MVTVFPLMNYAFIMGITPGPNNMMLAASSVCFGIKKTLPHLLGIQVGIFLLLLASGLGLNVLFHYIPGAEFGFKLLGSAYMLYILWSLQKSLFPENTVVSGYETRPLSWAAAAVFQLVNPKAWLMAMTGVTVFMPEFGVSHWSLMELCITFCAIVLVCTAVWVVLGAGIKHWEKSRVWQYVVMGTLMLLIVYGTITIWLD